MDTRNKLLPGDSPDATFTIDQKGKILSWSNAANIMLGYSRKEAIGKNVYKLIIPPNRRDEEKKLLWQIIKTGYSCYKSSRLHKNGSLKFVEVTNKAIHDKSGNLKHVLLNLKDVTSLSSLQDSKYLSDRFGALLESTADGMIISNLAGQIVLANSRVRKLFGYKKKELLGQAVEMLVPESLRKAHIRHRAKFNAQPSARSFAEKQGIIGLRRDSTTFPAEISLTPMKTDIGTIIISSIVDISQRKIAEEELKLTQIHLQTQLKISKILSDANSFEEIMPGLLKVICKNMEFHAGRVWEINRESGRFQCLAGWIDDPKILKKYQKDSLKLSIPTFSGIPGRVKKTRKPVWIESFSIDPHYKEFPGELRSLSKKYQFKGAVSLPILLNNEIKGVMTLIKREQLEFNSQLDEVLNSISNQIGQFLDRKTQQNSITRLNRIYTVLNGINNTMIHIHDRDRLLNNACDIVITSGKFRMAWIALLDDTKTRLSNIYSSSQKDARPCLSKLDYYLGRKPNNELVFNLINKQRSLISNNLQDNDTIPLAKTAVGMGCHSAVAIPIIVDKKPEGIIVIYATESNSFDGEEVLLIKEIANDISFAMQFIQNEERLKFLAYRDPLTGLNNRTALYSQLEETVLFNREGNTSFALLLANINNFRDINNTLGHQTGDELIKQVTQRLNLTVWESDNVARLGGDNFAILLHRLSDKEHISIVIDKIIKTFEESFIISDLPVNVEVTVGIALYPDHGESADLLWQHADVAVREARKLEHDHLFYSKEIDHYDPLKLSLIGELKNAIDHNDLVLHYQPKIDLSRKRTVGVEALIRWNHPDRGMIFPDSFIPLAEQTDLINPLTFWVLENSVRQVIQWHKNGYYLDLSVNISARNLQNPGLVDNILRIVSNNNFPLNKLLLELTETAIMADPIHAGKQLKKLFDVGIHLSIDDFGIGQSSLTYLKDLPLKNMKIDKSFIMNIHLPGNYAIVRSAVELGHNMDFDVTAEGIDDLDSLGKINSFNCNFGQGYYFSKPLPPEELIIWLENTEWVCIKE